MIFEKIKVEIAKGMPDLDDVPLVRSLIFLGSDFLAPYESHFGRALFSLHGEEDNRLGCFFVQRDELHIRVNFREIFYRHPPFKKALFFTILHGLGHALAFLRRYQNYTILSIEEYYNLRMPCRSLYANQFAFKNLSYLENLYDYHELLVQAED